MTKTIFILAAGFGTRLRPFTELYPKPMISVGKEPLILLQIRKLYKAGFRHIIINTSYQSCKLEGFIKFVLIRENLQDLKITILKEAEILGTGGALLNLKEIVTEDNFFIMNSDIIFEMDFNCMFEQHIKENAFASLWLLSTKEEKLKQVAVLQNNRISSIAGITFVSEESKNLFLFSGVHVVSRSIFSYLADGFQCIVRDVYKRAGLKGEKIMGFVNDSFWMDIGNIESFKEAQKRKLYG